MGSGASDSCAPQTLAPEVETCESFGSRAGQRYNAASGTRLANVGETFQMGDRGRQTHEWNVQIAYISKLLRSVR